MAPYSDYVRDQYRRPVLGALVYVYDKATGQLAALQTQSGGALPNPLKTDANGLFAFYAADATYRREVRLDNGVLLDASDIIVGNPPEYVGPTGPANSTYTSLAALKAAPSTNASYILTTTAGPITYAYVAGNFTGRADDANVVKLDAVPLTTGALVKSVETAAAPAGTAAAAFEASAGITGDIVVKPGTYNLGRAILLADSAALYGTGGVRGRVQLGGAGSDPAIKVYVAPDTGEYQRNGPNVSELTIYNAGGGIAIGDRNGSITEGGGERIYHYWRFDRLNIVDASDFGAGAYGDFGIQLTKAFDGRMQGCEVLGYKTGVLLNGSDINAIVNNRIHAFRDYGILEATARTFGSQNDIHGNDILGTPAKAFYKTMGHHVRFDNNYLEAQSDMPVGAGFIDVGPVDMPTFGGNPTETTKTLVLRDNRLDSQYRGDFTYRVHADSILTVRIEGVQTGDNSATPAYFCREDGTRDDTVPVHLTSGRARRMYIEEVSFGPVWDGYNAETAVTIVGEGYQITGRNIASLPYNTIVTGANGFVRLYGDQLVLPVGNADKNLAIFPGGYGAGNSYFAEDRLYEVAVMARCASGTEDLQIQMAGMTDTGVGFGTAFQAFAVSTQRKAYRFYVQGRSAAYQAVGFHIRSGTSASNIEFTLTWREVHGYWPYPVRIGERFYWTDMAGALRSKATAPTGDTDGTVIGPYTPPTP